MAPAAPLAPDVAQWPLLTPRVLTRWLLGRTELAKASVRVLL